MYNLCFTSLPLVYYILKRPSVYLQTLSSLEIGLLKLNGNVFLAFLIAIMITFVSVAMNLYEFEANFFPAVLYLGIFASNYYYLVIGK